jgi:hypothetical protein
MTVMSKAAFAWEYTRPTGNMASIRAGYLYSCDEEAKYSRTIYDPGSIKKYQSIDSFVASSTGYTVGVGYDFLFFDFIMAGLGVEHQWINTDIHYQEIYKGIISENDDQKMSFSRKTVIPAISIRFLLPLNIYLGGVVTGRLMIKKR